MNVDLYNNFSAISLHKWVIAHAFTFSSWLSTLPNGDYQSLNLVINIMLIKCKVKNFS